MKKQKLAPTPVLRAGTYTAYAVLEHVYRLVKAEPKRLNMQNWLSMLKGEQKDKAIPLAAQPACGTVACLAGWINVVTKNQGNYTATAALDRLGLDAMQDHWTRDPTVRRELNELFWSTRLRKTQVLSRLKTIMATFKEDLLASTVQVPSAKEVR